MLADKFNESQIGMAYNTLANEQKFSLERRERKGRTEKSMRKIATIQKIWKIEPIAGADRIELAHVLGWQCVVNKGQFQPRSGSLL